MTWQFTLSGLLIGLLVGMTGMGGGSLLTPILVIFFGFQPTTAVGTDVLHGAIFKSFGAVRHRRLGTVHARLTLWMFAGSGPMSLLGVVVATWLDRHSSGAKDIEAYAIGAALCLPRMNILIAKPMPPRISAAPTTRPIADCVPSENELAICTPTSDIGAEPTSIQSASDACTLPRRR